MANPVDAALVHHAADWPGVTTLPHDLGSKTWTVTRPAWFLDEDNPQWPDTATLQLTMPRVPWTPEECRRLVTRELGEVEEQVHKRVRAKGQRVLGRSAVLRGSPYAQATSGEPVRSLNPHIAVGRGQDQAFFEALNILRAFRQAYRAALAKWRDDIRDVLFPAATWLMRWLHRVRVPQVAPS